MALRASADAAALARSVALRQIGRLCMSPFEFVVSYAVPILILVVIAIIARSIRVANQYERGVVFRLGKYNRTAGPGLYLVWPIVEWQIKLDLRTVTRDVE